MQTPGPSKLAATIQYFLRVLAPFSGLLIVVFFFMYLNRDTGRYLSADNLKAIAIQTAIIGTCGIGMTMIIIGGGIDLSIGSSVALSTVVIGLVFNGVFFPTVTETVFLGQAWVGWLTAGLLSLAVFLGQWWSERQWWHGLVTVAIGWLSGFFIFHQQGGVPAVFAGVLVGILCGMLNGVMITGTRVVPFIITLGTMEIFRGGAQLLAKGESVGVDSRVLREQYGWLRRLMSSHPEPSWLILGPGVWMMLAAGVASVVVLRRTKLGRYIFAIGSNEQAAVLSGVRVPRIKLMMYGGAGMLTGLAGVMQFSRLSYGSSTASVGLELDVIAAVVIGGGSLRGGEGSILGTFIGAYIMGFMRNGCDLAGIPNAVQRVLVGVIIILAVALDEIRHRRK